MGPLISIIHPSRSRPYKSKAAFMKWFENSDTHNFQWITSLDEDDPNKEEYLAFSNCIVSKNRSAVDAINAGSKEAKADIMMVVSDDTDCPENWDTKIINATSGKKDFILKTQDGIQPWIITMPIMDRAYYNRFGYIYHPDYLHMFCDTELTCVADITGRKLTSNLLFPHKHYSVTKEQPDAINKKADATWAQGEKLFLERYKRNFDLPPGQHIQDKGMINWLQ